MSKSVEEASFLERYYGDSLLKALQAVYPEHKWMIWRFKVVSPNFWENLENQRDFFDWMALKCGFKTMDDWYNVTIEEVNEHGGSRLLNHYFHGSTFKAVQAIYPKHNWMPWKFKTSQAHIWSKTNSKVFLILWGMNWALKLWTIGEK